MAAVCALLPSVSENDRNSASTAINSAIFLLNPTPCSPSCAFSIVSCISDMMPLSLQHVHFAHHCGERKRRNNPDGGRTARFRPQWRLRARMGGAIGLDQALGVDRGVDLRRR